MLEILNITKVFRKDGGEIRAVDDLSWKVTKGTFAVVHGRSGSGKSTLLMMAGGMMLPTAGRIVVEGRDVYALPRSQRNTFRKKSVGFVFQRFHLLPYFTVYENIALPLAMSKTNGAHDAILRIATTLGIADRINHYPSELSIGQQQRVAMARALVHEPDIVLADEPTGNLDQESGSFIVEQLRTAADSGKTVIAVTHDEHVLNKADHTLHITDGRICSAS